MLSFIIEESISIFGNNSSIIQELKHCELNECKHTTERRSSCESKPHTPLYETQTFNTKPLFCLSCVCVPVWPAAVSGLRRALHRLHVESVCVCVCVWVWGISTCAGHEGTHAWQPQVSPQGSCCYYGNNIPQTPFEKRDAAERLVSLWSVNSSPRETCQPKTTHDCRNACLTFAI